MSRKKKREERFRVAVEAYRRQRALGNCEFACEFATVPTDPRTVCGKPATKVLIDPFDPVGPFHVCEEHWKAMMTGRKLDLTDEVRMKELAEEIELNVFLAGGQKDAKTVREFIAEYLRRALGGLGFKRKEI
jgi:hypothetical protein